MLCSPRRYLPYPDVLVLLLLLGAPALAVVGGAQQPPLLLSHQTAAGQQQQAEQPPPAEPETPPDDDELLAGDDDLLADDDDLLADDDALLAGDDLLSSDDLLADDQEAADEEQAQAANASLQAHEQLFLETKYPSAATCATCHPKQYREWSVSQHAYAQLSPLMMAMQNAINVAVSTTAGDFCLRCHAPIGAELREPFAMSNLERHPASREGITCVACHRMSQRWGKMSGRLSFEQGDVFAPVYGPTGPAELERVLENRDTYRVVTSHDEPGRAIHTEVKRFFALTTPGFCGTCHDVTNVNGFRLEEAFSSYKHSPAARRGVTCNDCHMGTIQGKAAGYETGPAAMVGGVPTSDRKLTSHYFAGPDAPIVHPGIFPVNVRANRLKTMQEWLLFDVEAGWGTDAFEDNLPEGFEFPDAWRAIDDRYDARELIEEQLALLAWAREQRIEVMQNGLSLGTIEVSEASPGKGISFAVEVASATDGHLVPTGFDAERIIFLEVSVTAADGTVVYRSGDRDPNGDLRDTHSVYVAHGAAPLDRDLFSLQSKFITRLVRGGEREQVLPINTSVSAVPLFRPESRPTILYGRPAGARKQRRGLEPGGSATARYSVPAANLTGTGQYRINVKLRYQAVPVNLIAAIQGVGFDYGLSPREVADRVVNSGEVIWERETTVTLVP